MRAGLCAAPHEWPWSSARSHLDDAADGLCERRPLFDLVGDWGAFLASDSDAATYQRLRAGERTGRPLADSGLIDHLEAVLGRRIHRQTPSRKPASRQVDAGRHGEMSTVSP